MNQHARVLKDLHKPGAPLILANVYDIPSARAVAAHPSCKALATASFAVAQINGTEDNDLQLDANLASVRAIARVAQEYQKPLTADIQDGYGSRLEEAIRQLIDCGVSGVNLEDCDKGAQRMYSKDEAVKNIGRVLDVAKAQGVPDFVINARCDVLIQGGGLEEVIDRGKAYLAAGATSVFVWGGSKRGVAREEVVRLAEAFEGRLSVIFLLSGAGLSVRELADIGICRMSVGPGLFRLARDTVTKAAEELLTSLD